MTEDWADYFQSHIEKEMERQQDIITNAVLRSLGTRYGVKVVRKGSRLISAEPDPSVPPMQLHEYREEERA